MENRQRAPADVTLFVARCAVLSPARRAASFAGMKTLRSFLLSCVCAVSVVRAGTTPLDMALPEQKELTIACELSVAPKKNEVPVFNTKEDGEAAKGTYHYKLWLPKGYNDDAKRTWPCMFVASAGGNAGMGNMASWLKANEYVVVMLVESKNGPWPPIVGNFLAAHDDVVKRVRIQEGLKLATGMSGGARASTVFAQLRPGFGGLVLQGAGAAFERSDYLVAKLKGSRAVHVAMTMGEKDSNKGEVARMKSAIGSGHFEAFLFDGGHVWAPAEVFEKAAAWVEGQIYRDRDTSPAVKKILQARCAKAAR